MLFLFPILILVQVLVFNHIMLFNLAVPFVFIYFILRLPIGMPANLVLSLSFLIGMLVDIFSDTPGVNALACTVLAAVKTPVFYAYVPRDDKTKRIVPAISTLGWQTYAKFLITMVAIFCLLCFIVEYFSFAGFLNILAMAGTSTALSFFLIFGIDSLIKPDANILVT
ncbi:MAG: rod shape-determining protein MreD [Bacteroides sp.]|nr:rod shape-determining protein MreD [Bacteroides sp.]